MKYAVFGVGRQGVAVIHDLLERCGATKVAAFDVADVSARLREAIGAAADKVELHRLSPGDESSANQIVELIRGSACAISALPYALNPAATRLCIRAKVPLCDLGGNPDIVAEQARMCDGSALVVPDCGLAPGLNNILAVYLRQKHDAVAIRAYCGGIPARRDPANPLQYKLLFSPWGLISEYSGRCAVLRDGRVEFVEALTGLEELPGDREAFYTSNNSPLTFEHLKSIGVRDYEYKTVRWRGHLEKVLLLKALGFFRGDRAIDQALADGLARQEWLRFDRSRDVDETYLRVEGTTAAGKREAVGITVRGTPQFSAMELTTSWGVTIPALWIAKAARDAGRALPAGCHPPQRVIDPAWAMDELARRTAAAGA
jgi:lysine 6-dehydrogenase